MERQPLNGGVYSGFAMGGAVVIRIVLVCAVLGAALAVQTAAAVAEPGAAIRRTANGIPHIKADDFEGIGYGYGYAIAEDNLCVLADTYVTVRAERSRFFGPQGSYASRGNGTRPNNLNSDFFFQRIIDTKVVENLLARPLPVGPKPEIREGVRGFVRGYNQYLAETGVDNLPDPGCRGEEWVRPISELDVFRRFYQLILLASSGVAIDGIAGAQPPTPALTPDPPSEARRLRMIDELKDKLPLGAIGSNAYGLGKGATDNGRGMVLGNPHFPWDGPERFYQAQLTIPGKANVAGASLFGVPIILIGHTANLAWSHTVSTAYRFTPYELKLVPGSPTTYLVDGRPREMKRDRVTVMVKGAGGELEPRTRTLYSSDQGPIFTSILGQPLFPWTPATAYAMGDANATNFRAFNHFFDKNQAQSVEDLDAIERRYQGIPWVNTIAADSKGRAYYADIGTVPHVTNEKSQRCVNSPVGLAVRQVLGLPILDGSQSSCEWGADPEAPVPGILGHGKMPSLFRDDYVTNSNDSFWLSNPLAPLEGFPDIIGDERTERTQRTRLGLRIVQDRLSGADGQPGNRFSLQQLQDAVFNNRNYAGELWRDELAAFCEANPSVLGTDVSEACPALRAWDLRDDLDSNGAILFRRFTERLNGTLPLVDEPGVYDVPFDAADPVNTPRGLNTLNPLVQKALADAVKDLRDSNIPLDAPLRGYQYERRADEKIPIHGGPGGNGVFNAINVPWVPGQGYPNVPSGSSFVMAMQFTDGCPESRSIMTYSQSTNPESPFFADQTRLYARKQWVDMRFCEREIRADLRSVKRLGTAEHDCRGSDTTVTRPRLRRGERIRSVRATVDGEPRGVRRLRGSRRARISFRGMQPDRATLRLSIRTTADRVIRDRRTVRTCGSSPR